MFVALSTNQQSRLVSPDFACNPEALVLLLVYSGRDQLGCLVLAANETGKLAVV